MKSLGQSGILIIAALSVSGVGTGVDAADFSPAMKRVIASAQKEGELQLNWGANTAGGEKGASLAEAGMNKMFGTHVRVTFTPGESMPAIGFRMLAEKSAGRKALSDIYIGAMVQVGMFEKRGLFQKVDYSALLPGRITPNMVEANNTAVRVATSVSGVVYNTKLAPYRPKHLADFLKPEWKGKIAGTPYLANYDFLADSQVLGVEGAIDYVKKLSGQISGLIRCPDTERILSGEFLVLMFDCGGAEAFEAKEKGAPLDQAVPFDYGKVTYYYMAIPAHAAHPAAAQEFIAYMLTQEGQDILWKEWQIDLHTYPGSHMGARVSSYEKEGVKFREYDVKWWAANPQIAKAKNEMVNILVKKRSR